MEQKKFKCLSCGQKFEANDRGQVICPHCHSDNVTPCKSNAKKLLPIFAILFCFLFGYIISRIIPGSDSKPRVELDVTILDLTWDGSTQTYSFEVSVSNLNEEETVEYELCTEQDEETVFLSSTNGSFKNIPPSKNEIKSYWLFVTAKSNDKTRKFSQEILGFPDHEVNDSLYLVEVMQSLNVTTTSPKMDKKNNYSFKATVSPVPDDVNVSYMLCETYGNQLLVKSVDGAFKDIAPSTNDINSYNLVIILEKNGTQKQKDNVITGFIPPSPSISNPITAQELQSYIDKRDSKALGSSNNKIARSVKIHAVGLQEDDFPPETLADILQRFIIGQWSSAKVTGVGYNSKNQLNSVSISVVYP